MHELVIQTHRREELLDMTAMVQKIVGDSGVENGLAVIFSPHTTLAVTVNENTDQAVRHDILTHLASLVPQSPTFRHQENNSDSHIKVSLVGPSVTLIVSDGDIQLGTWQAIYACEFDGPRTRRVWVQLVG